MARLFWSIIFLSLQFVSAFAAHFHWEVITNFNNIQNTIIRNDTIYAATNGGFLVFPINNSPYRIWNSEQGLTAHNFNTIAYSPKGIFILGTQKGIITFFNQKEKQFGEDASLFDNEITGLFVIEDTLWVTAKKLVAVFQYNSEKGKYEFRDFFNNFNHNFNKFYGITYYQHHVWVASDSGLFRAPGNYLKYNLKSSDSWQVLTENDGLPTSEFYAFGLRNDTLFIGSRKGLIVFDGSNYVTYSHNLPNRSIYHIFLGKKKILVSSLYRIARLNGEEFEVLFNMYPNRVNDFLMDSNGHIWVAPQEKGIWNLHNDSKFYFNGPVDNRIGEILLDSSRRLWLVTGGYKDARFKGFSVLTPDGIWHNYRHIGKGWKQAASTITIEEDVNGNMWIGSWGGGITIVDKEFNFYHFNNFANSGNLWIASETQDDTLSVEPPDSVHNFLSSVIGYSETIVIPDILLDRFRGVIWILNLTPQNHRPIIQYQYDSFGSVAFQNENWVGIEIPQSINVQYNAVTSLGLDIFNNLWIGTAKSGVVGMIFKEDNSVDWVNITETNNLKSNQCLAVAGDQDGYVWFGTAGGLNAYLNGKLYDFREDYQPIGLRINYIFVDTENNKWFATDKGVSFLKASGSPWDPKSWIHLVPQESEFYGDNIFHTNLPDEEVLSVFVDSQTGDVYCGTNSGLAIMRSNPFTTPRKNYSALKIGPQPFLIKDNAENAFYFRNLTGNSQIKIISLSGRLVRILDNSDAGEIIGSLARWDGRNEEGRLVSSGVYLFLISDETGNSTSGKILVIHK